MRGTFAAFRKFRAILAGNKLRFPTELALSFGFLGLFGCSPRLIGALPTSLDTTVPGEVTGFSMTSPSNATISAYPTIPVSGTAGTAAGGTPAGTNLTIKFYLNDNTCAVGNLVGTVSAAPGAAFSVTTSSLTAGGDGTKTLYYTIEDAATNIRACAATGLSYTYQANPVVSFTQMGYTLKESGPGTQVGTEVTVQRDVCGVATTVTVTTSNVTAMSGTNFTAGAPNVVFAASDCSPKTISAATFAVASDAATTGELFFKAMITSVVGGVTSTVNQIAQVNIVDSALPGDFMFNQPLYTVNSGGTSATLTVQRGGSTAAAASVDVAFVNGSAISATDYTGTTQTMNFGIGEDEKTITVPVFPNTYNASFIAKLVNPSTGTSMRNMSVAKVRIMGDTGTCNAAGAPFGGGDGSTGTPFLICTLTQLKQVASNLTSTFKLVADITNDGTMTPLGTLTGNFNGDEHIVYNFSFNGNTAQVGFFNGATTGTYIKGVNLLNLSVINTNVDTGGLIGRLGNSAVMPAISNSLVSGYVSSTATYAGLLAGSLVHAGAGNPVGSITRSMTFGTAKNTTGYTGGIVGRLTSTAGAASYLTTLDSLFNAATVLGTSDSGGLVGGLFHRGTATISTLENRGYVFSSSLSRVGGVFGLAQSLGASTGTFTGLTNYAKVQGSSTQVGGIAGFWYGYASSTMDSVTNYGPISGTNTVGGLFGLIQDTTTLTSSHTISNSSNQGTVTAVNGSAIGGILGSFGISNTSNGNVLVITSSNNQGAISAGWGVGGIVGSLNFGSTGASPTTNAATISNSYNTGAISGSHANSMVGGILGRFLSTSASDPSLTLDTNTSSTGAITCSAGPYCGGLAGSLQVSGTKTSTISNSSVTTNVSGVGQTGGLVGVITLTSGTSTLNVTGSAYSGIVSSTGWAAGGLIGYMYNNSGTFLLSRSHAAGSVTSTSYDNAGLIGNVDLGAAPVSTLIEKSYSTSSVSGTNHSGGLVGQLQTAVPAVSATIADSSSTGTVTGGGDGSGGVVGYFFESGGGACTANLTRIYTTSIVTGTAASGLVGSNAGCTVNITATYWLKDTGLNAGLANDGNQRPVFDLQNLIGQGTATYTGWTFGGGGPWNVFVPGTYPTLQ